MGIREAADSRLLSQGVAHPIHQVYAKIGGLLNAQIARNAFHQVEGNRLEEMFEKLQNVIHNRIGKMAEPVTTATPQPAVISWTEENIRLQSFYKCLRDLPDGNPAFWLCETLRAEADQQIHDFSRSSLSPSEMQAQNMTVILCARELIGKVVFAAERDLDGLNAEIDLDNLAASNKCVEGIVQAQLQKVLNELADKNKTVNNYCLQDRDMEFYTEEPKEIARLLLTSQGQLNLGMIGAIKDQFFPASEGLLEYQQGIIFVLDRMDISWQKLVDAVELPASPQTASNATIRADRGMLPGDAITQLHCQQEVFGALLSQLCQGPVGDCFAVAWAIKKHDEFLLDMVADGIALVRDGYLTRMVDGKLDQFFFKNTIADESMRSQITLNPDGTVSEYRAQPFWACPNLIAACRQMGITDLDTRKDVLLAQVFGSETAAKTVTWDDLIQTCAANAASASHMEDELLVLGRYGFSLANNRLLRAWETSLAGMGEARSNDYVRGNVHSAVMAVLKPVFANQEKRITHYQKTLIEEVKTVFQKTLNDSFRFVYNGDIPLAAVSSDGSSSSGGFELYQRDVADLTKMGVRIATPDQFRAFILGIIDQTKAAEYAKVTTTKDRAVVDSVIQALHMCASGNDFMKNVLYAYDDANKQDPDPVAHYQNLARTPMTSLDGDNPWEVMAIDRGEDFTPNVKAIRPKDPGALLKWLLGLASWKESTEHYLSDGIPDEEDSAASPQHAFNIEIEGPEFKDFLGSKLSADEWINKTLVEPGMKISKAEMDKGARLLYKQNVNAWLSNQFKDGIPDHLMQEMETLFKSLSSKETITVQQFAQRSQDGLVSIFKLNADQTRQLSLGLDGLLLQSLPKAQSEAIQKAAVRFAKTNWDTGPKNLFFCCFFNPRTQKADFGSIAEDKTGLQPMDQYEWVDNQQWEVDPVLIK